MPPRYASGATTSCSGCVPAAFPGVPADHARPVQRGERPGRHRGVRGAEHPGAGRLRGADEGPGPRPHGGVHQRRQPHRQPSWTTPTTACPSRPCSAPFKRSTPAAGWSPSSAVRGKRPWTAGGTWGDLRPLLRPGGPHRGGLRGGGHPLHLPGDRLPCGGPGLRLLHRAQPGEAIRQAVLGCREPSVLLITGKGRRPARSGAPSISTPPLTWTMSSPFFRSTTCATAWTAWRRCAPCCPFCPSSSGTRAGPLW